MKLCLSLSQACRQSLHLYLKAVTKVRPGEVMERSTLSVSRGLTMEPGTSAELPCLQQLSQSLLQMDVQLQEEEQPGRVKRGGAAHTTEEPVRLNRSNILDLTVSTSFSDLVAFSWVGPYR